MHIRGFHRRLFAPLAPFVLLATTLAANLSYAEPVIDQLASGARVSASNGCALLMVYFHVRVRYIGHFPQQHGEELRISLQPIDPSLLGQLRQVRR